MILAHRDASGAGAQAELSGTAALLELARVFAARETQRTIVLVSTSGGSGGDAGAMDFLAHQDGPVDAAIVLGNLAGKAQRKPFVVPYSDGFGSASELLQRTVAGAIMLELGGNPGAPSALGQLAHLAFPFATGEQGALNAAGLQSVLVQASSERVPPRGRSGRRGTVGRLRSRGADRGRRAGHGAGPRGERSRRAWSLGRQVIPEWALRLLLAALLIPPLLLTADGYARLRRRRGRAAIARSPEGWAGPRSAPCRSSLAALFAKALGSLGALHAAPAMPTPAGALPLGAEATRAVLAVVLVFALCWLAWPRVVRRLGLRVRPENDARPRRPGDARRADRCGVVVWALNPYAALLVLPAMHLWLLIVDPRAAAPAPGGACADRDRAAARWRC